MRKAPNLIEKCLKLFTVESNALGRLLVIVDEAENLRNSKIDGKKKWLILHGDGLSLALIYMK